MSEFLALTWKVKPGSERTVEDLFRHSGSPEHVIRGADGAQIGRLLSTLVFMKDNVVVRVIEFEGSPRDVAQHMGRQPEVISLERSLEPYIDTPRDLSSPAGVQKFFSEASMRSVLARRHDATAV